MATTERTGGGSPRAATSGAPGARGPRRAAVLVALMALLAAGCGAAQASGPPAGRGAHHTPGTKVASTSSTTSASSTTTTSTTVAGGGAPGGGDHGPITSPPLPAPGPGFGAGHVTAVGDSVMIDYEQPLEADIPGIAVTASVGRQWTQGEAILEQLKSEGELGAVVIVGLGTNGPITTSEFDATMSILSGASRVVFVNVHVDRTWQDSNDAVLAAGISRYPRAVLVDWNALAEANPGWLYPTGTHLPPGGTGAQALAALVAGAA
jgi:hypothetical protein